MWYPPAFRPYRMYESCMPSKAGRYTLGIDYFVDYVTVVKPCMVFVLDYYIATLQVDLGL